MYARVIFTQSRPDQGDEAIHILRESVVLEQKKQHGFKGIVLLSNRAVGKGISITFWETEADLQASDQASQYYQEQMAKVSYFFVAAPLVETYEVTDRE